MVYMFLAECFEEIEALCPLDLLRRAGVEVKTVAVGDKTVSGAHGIKVVADMTENEFSDAKPDMIILPGGMPGSTNLDSSKTVDAALRAGAKNGAFLCAICAAPLVLGKRGLLRGKNAVCYPGFEQYLEGVTIYESGVVHDGKCITAKGMGAAFEFGLELVRALKDNETAERIRASVYAK